MERNKAIITRINYWGAHYVMITVLGAWHQLSRLTLGVKERGLLDLCWGSRCAAPQKSAAAASQWNCVNGWNLQEGRY